MSPPLWRRCEEEGSLEGAEDRAEWEDFLKLLMRYRKRSPINGIILTVKIPDILTKDALQRERTGEILRKALLDIEERLKIQCPVYLMVSMCDLIPGFYEFFSLLPGLSDRSLLGWSRSGRFDLPLDPADMKQGLGKLTRLLRDLRLNFLNEKAGLTGNDPEEAGELDKLYAFPDEFEAMLEPLQSMLKKAFEPSAYYQSHFLRGIFFTSALQKGEPVLWACQDLLGSKALSPQSTQEAAAKSSKAFFIADFFEEKVFAERGLVKLPTRASREKKLKERLTLITGGALLLGSLGWMVMRGIDLHSKAGGVTGALGEVQDVVNKDTELKAADAAQLPHKLKALHENLSELKEDRAWINAGNVEETVEQGSFTVVQTFIYRCFRPALAEYLSGDRKATRWEEGHKTFRILAALHRLSLENSGAEAAGSNTSWVKDFERVINGLDSAGASGLNRLSDQLPVSLDAIENNESCRLYLSSLLADELVRANIWQCLRDWVLDPWMGMVRRLKENPEQSQQIWLEADLIHDASRAWALDRVFSVEKRFEIALIELRQILTSLKQSDNWKSTEAYRNKILTLWCRHYEKIEALIYSAEQFAQAQPAIQNPESALRERLAWFQELKTELMVTHPPRGMSEGAGRAWTHISNSLLELETQIARKNESIRGWLKKDGQSNHFLFLLTDEKPSNDESATQARREIPDKRISVQDLKQLKQDLEGFHNLVTYDITTDTELDPGRDRFWELPQGIEGWLNNRFAFLSDLASRAAESSPGRKSRATLLNTNQVAVVREGFRNRMLLSLYGWINALCGRESERLIRSLGEVCRKSAKSSNVIGSAPFTFFPVEGYAFTRPAVEKFNYWAGNVQDSFTELGGSNGTGIQEWRKFILNQDPLSDFTYGYIEAFDQFWGAGVTRKLSDYLTREKAPEAADGLKELAAWMTWPEKQGSMEFRGGLGKLLKRIGQQTVDDMQRAAWVDPDCDYREGYLFWERYSNEETRNEVNQAGERFFQALDALAGKVKDPAFATDPSARVELLKLALGSKSGLLAFHEIRTALSQDKSSPKGRFLSQDPVLNALAGYADRIRGALKRVSEELFVEQWPLVASSAESVEKTFPFQGSSLPSDSDGMLQVADWNATLDFLKGNPFQDLAETVGAAFIDETPLFTADIQPEPKMECFKRLTQLQHLLIREPNFKVQVDNVEKWTVAQARWYFIVWADTQALEEIEFSATSLNPFGFSLSMDGKPFNTLIRARKFNSEEDAQLAWDSFHPLPVAAQDSPWNFLALLWLWGRYDLEKGTYAVNFNFPSEENRNEARNTAYKPDNWQERMEENDVKEMELLIRVPGYVPSQAPDLRDAGWGRR